MNRAMAMAIMVIALLMSPASTGSAVAHTSLVAACPGPGDVVNSLTEIGLEFASPLIDDGLAKIDLLANDGEEEVSVGPTLFSEDLLTLSAEVLAEVPAGRYIVRYLVTSRDGDLNDGGHEFTLDPDADAESDTCGGLDEGGGAGGWVVLVIGVAAVGALALFLRPKKKDSDEDRVSGEPEE